MKGFALLYVQCLVYLYTIQQDETILLNALIAGLHAACLHHHFNRGRLSIEAFFQPILFLFSIFSLFT